MCGMSNEQLLWKLAAVRQIRGMGRIVQYPCDVDLQVMRTPVMWTGSHRVSCMVRGRCLATDAVGC
jgi:hypothetical protein